MFYPDELVEDIRSRIDIVDLISPYVKLKKNGANYVGLCPFHNEKTPSFSVSRNKQMYYCFGCGAGGNAYTFVMDYDNLTFQEAVKQLAGRVGVDLPENDYSEQEKSKAGKKKRLLDLHCEAGKYYYAILKSPQGKLGLDYFKSRGLSEDIINKFGLGYTGRGSLYNYLKNKGYTDEELKESGLVTYNETKGALDKFWNRVMFPVMDVNNHVIAFGGRVLGDAKPKYLNSPATLLFDKSRNLYGMNYARHSRKEYILLCEGYMDVIALHQAGFDNACASLGTALTGLQANLIKRYVKKVVITYDSDAAGTKAALRAIPILKEAGISVKVLNMDPYKDPDEFIKALGSEEYEKRIDEAKSSFDFEVGILERQYDLNDPEQKTQFFNDVAGKILAFEDDLERSNYIEAVSSKYNIRPEDMRKLVAKLSAHMAGIPVTLSSAKEKKDKSTEGNAKAQEILLTWITNEPDIIDKISEFISEGDFYEEPYKTIASIVFEQYNSEHSINPARIINIFEEAEAQRKAAGIINNSMPVEEFDRQERERVLNELLKRIKQQSLDHFARNAKSTDDLKKVLDLKTDLQNMHISL